jgi:CCR4-NOT transcription complex subunit 9
MDNSRSKNPINNQNQNNPQINSNNSNILQMNNNNNSNQNNPNPQNNNNNQNNELNNSGISSGTTVNSSMLSNIRDDEASIIQMVNEIKDENTREAALDELSHKRESLPDLALYIWYSTGTVATLLQEIIYTYQLLAPPKLTIQTSNRACSVLALFQCVAAHKETRPAFLQAQIPIFLYPFLNTVNKTRPFEYLRLTALGVIGALVKVDNSEVITFLLSTEIIPLCLRIMERGSELSKTVATFIVQRILLDNNGLDYICSTAERFYAISSVLSNMIKNNPTQRLIKHIIRSYARLADKEIVREILKENLPPKMKEKEFINKLDDSSKKWMNNLIKALNEKNNNQIHMNNNMGNIGNNGNNGNNNNMIPNYIMMNPNFMMQSNNDFNNYNMYNNDNYMNRNIYMGNLNQNKAYGNMNFYNKNN